MRKLAIIIAVIGEALAPVVGLRGAPAMPPAPATAADGIAAAAGPPAVARGVTYARIDAAGTQVEARFELNGGAQALDSLLLPVFALRGAAAAEVLERSKFLAHLGPVQLEEVAVARAPAGAPRPPPGSQILWFRFPLKDSEPGRADEDGRFIFKVSYWQPHVAGHFHYLHRNLSPADRAGRAGQHILVVRSLTRLVDAPGDEVEYERLADVLVVFPKPGVPIAIPTGRSAAPSARSGSPAPSSGSGKARP